MSELIGLCFWAALITSIIICFRKGKPGMGIGGVFTLGTVSLIGASRLAKPDSPWARQNYPPNGPKMVTSCSRFGAAIPSTPLAAPRRASDDELKVGVASSPERPELPSIPGLAPIADKLVELSAQSAAAGASFEILEQSSRSAVVRISQDFTVSKSRCCTLTLLPGRQVSVEFLKS